MKKRISSREAAAKIFDGATIMVGGFMGCGSPHQIIDELAKSGTSDLTLICNDGAMLQGPRGEDHYGVAKLIHNRQIKKLIASHVGLNPEIAEQMNNKIIEVVLVPQGSLAEMIRAGGSGLGGVITPTGVGTIVEDSEHVFKRIEIDGETYLIEKPLHADFSLISAYYVDSFGNSWYKGSTKNFNIPMATAADTVIVEADHIVEPGEIRPENVMTSGILIDYIVDGKDCNK